MNPEILYAAGLAADYCSTDEGWEHFTDWLRREGLIDDYENLDREIMMESLSAIKSLVKQAEIELFQMRLAEALKYDT